MKKTDMKCPECGARMTLRRSRHGLFWGCIGYPVCSGSHGAHQETGEPLGIPANAETRKARRQAHIYFDTRWKREPIAIWKQARPAAYKWLAEQLGIPVDDCHIGKFDLATCLKVVELCKIEKEF